ncbi:gamma-glutamyltransferase [Aeromicrobium camelliae]|uniref:gamma-glutamyltransferase n=1 Tax=Aeromicrobium camelliae TaxID=1538144 RepID=UPI001FB6093E|nr:gamma-glutamyltransferase [Aeromicrobium camelliae]
MGGRGLDDREHLVAVQRRVLGERLRVFDRSEDLARDAAAFLDLVDREGLAVLESGSTAHISATDTDGNACAITVSSGYGSGMIARGTGIWLNNCLGEQELNPRGLHGLEPGTRLLSNMAPTVGHDRQGASLAIGSPGADRITTAIAQVVTGFLSGLDLQAAIDHPRVHLHRAGCPDEELKVEQEPSMYFGGVGATLRDHEGRLHAAADPRREGATRIV